jgi:hypothetical protein
MQNEEKRNLLIAFSAYSTKGPYSIDEWLKVQDMKRNDPDFKKKYDKLRNPK